jgi:hypothetical protein
MAHRPLVLQKGISGRSFETHYVGAAPAHKNGILLFNPTTHRSIIRKTFKVIGPSNRESNYFFSPVFESDFIDNIDNDDDIMDNESVNLHAPLPNTPNVCTGETNTTDIVIIPASATTSSSSSNYVGKYEFTDIIKHKSDKKCTKKSLKFMVKWLDNYKDSWVSWNQIKNSDILQKYLQSNVNLNHLSKTALYVMDILNINTDNNDVPVVMSFLSIHNDIKISIDKAVNSSRGDAIMAEAMAHKEFNSYEVPENINTIPENQFYTSRCILDDKYIKDQFVKHKARYVIGGNKKKHTPVLESYSPTVQSDSLMMFFVIAAEEDLHILGVDSKRAFLQTKVPDGVDIYVKRPPGLNDTHMPRKLRLLAYWYGLPEASRAFYDLHDKILCELGFVPTLDDPLFYRLDNPELGTYVLAPLHVDNLLLGGKKY